MRVPMRPPSLALACLSFCIWNFCSLRPAAAQQSDQIVAERILGPRWKQLSRRAGMIFAGTVLATAPPFSGDPKNDPNSILQNSSLTSLAITTNASPTAPTQPAISARPYPGPTPSIQLTFRVDQAIAGVEPGQILTIHEWAGAWSMHRPMFKGQHILLFLYPPSRLGLTSPVGGSLGQIFLDQTGNNVSQDAFALKSSALAPQPRTSSPPSRASAANQTVSVRQLARAIRGARANNNNEEE
jgi:hypothetical protein